MTRGQVVYASAIVPIFSVVLKYKVSYFSQMKKRQHIDLRRFELASIFVA